MPNWTTCKLEAPADVLRKYIGRDDNGCRTFDFNLVIPRPEIYEDPDLACDSDKEACIYWYKTNRDEDGVKRFRPAWKKRCLEKSDEFYRRGEKYVEAYEKYGYYDWYDWSNANWGTKWNACDSTFDQEHNEPEYVCFDTAWCWPEPIVRKIFEDNPGCEITFEWADEDYDGDHWLIRHEDGTIEEGCDFDECHFEEE